MEAGHSLMKNNSAIGSMSQNGSTIGAGYAHVDLIKRIRKIQQYMAHEQSSSQQGLYQIRMLKHALEIPLQESILVDEYKSVLRIIKGIKVNSKHLASVIFYIILKRSKMNFNLNDLLINANLTRQKFFKLLQQIMALDSKLRMDIMGEETLLYYNDAELLRAQEKFGFTPKMMSMVRKILSEEKYSPIPRINATVGLFLTVQKFRNMGLPVPKGVSVVKLSRFMQVAPSTIYSNLKRAITASKPIKAAIEGRATRGMPCINPVAVAVREELAPTKISTPSIIPLTIARATVKISPEFTNLVFAIKSEINTANSAHKRTIKGSQARSIRQFTPKSHEQNSKIGFPLASQHPHGLSRSTHLTKLNGAVYEIFKSLTGQRALGLAESGKKTQFTFPKGLAGQRVLGSSDLLTG
jgi:hypothetical protein